MHFVPADITDPASPGKLVAETERLLGGYEGFADEFSMILSRQLDKAA